MDMFYLVSVTSPSETELKVRTQTCANIQMEVKSPTSTKMNKGEKSATLLTFKINQREKERFDRIYGSIY